MVMGQLTTKTEVLVIGGGPGGYTAAIRAAQLGKEVILVEKNRLGGVCTNIGCIPSKALIHIADNKYNLEKLGFKTSVNFEKVQHNQNSIVLDLVKGIEQLCKSNKVEVIKGTAYFKDEETVEVSTEEGTRVIKYDYCIIATGTRRKEHPKIKYDNFVISSDEVFSLTTLPKRIAILGGGYIAVEMANLFAKLGSEVKIIYRGERLLKKFPYEISRIVEIGLKELSVDILYKTEIKEIEQTRIKLTNGKEFFVDKLLLAIGRDPVLDIGLDKANVEIENNRIKVDKQMRTSNKRIFAVGDVVPGPALAHKAFMEGKVAAEAISGLPSEFDSIIPQVVFSNPPIAIAGEMEGKSVRYPLFVLGAAKTKNEKLGYLKIIYDNNQTIIGIQIVGQEAPNLISEGVFAIEMGATLEDLALTIHPHPTVSEIYSECSELALGKAIHLTKIGNVKKN